LEALIYTKEAKLNLLQKMEQKTIESSKKRLHSACKISFKSSEEKDKECSRKLAQKITVSQIRVIVPPNLPKFRKGQTKEPTEFLEAFEKIMKAHAIVIYCYLYLVLLYLNTIDG
jgi:hypothetical protein